MIRPMFRDEAIFKDLATLQLFLQTEREHSSVPRTHINIPIGKRDAAVVIPTVHRIAACIKFVARRGVQRIQDCVSRVSSTGIALAKLLASLLERLQLRGAPRSVPFESGFVGIDLTER